MGPIRPQRSCSSSKKPDRWTPEDDWPLPPDAHATRLYLSGVRSGSVDSLNDGALDARVPTSSATVALPYTPDGGPFLPVLLSATKGRSNADQRPFEQKVATWTTAPFSVATEVTGYPRVTIWAASSAADGDLVFSLNDVGPDGISHQVMQGYFNAPHAADLHSAPTPLEPGELKRYELELFPMAYVFAAGHRIRLAVARQAPRRRRSSTCSHRGPGRILRQTPGRSRWIRNTPPRSICPSSVRPGAVSRISIAPGGSGRRMRRTISAPSEVEGRLESDESGAMSKPDRIETAARQFVRQRLSLAPIDPAEDMRPENEFEAYAFQAAVNRQLSQSGLGLPVGRKIGCTTPVVQAYPWHFTSLRRRDLRCDGRWSARQVVKVAPAIADARRRMRDRNRNLARCGGR